MSLRSVSPRGSSVRFVLASVVAALILGIVGSVGADSGVPVLGHSRAVGQRGYGHARPSEVFNGGDPTGLVTNIHWASWGGSRAVGVGTSTYVWPGTAVADNGPNSRAHIVAFHRGTCRGRKSYNAIEWYFPEYGETFDPHTYIDACTGAYVGPSPSIVECKNVSLVAGGKTATSISAVNLSCSTARTLIAHTPAGRFAPSETPVYMALQAGEVSLWSLRRRSRPVRAASFRLRSAPR